MAWIVKTRESVDVAFGDVAFQICENGVFKEKNVRLNSAGCEPHSRSDECFLFENPIFTLLKRHVRKRHVYRLPILVPDEAGAVRARPGPQRVEVPHAHDGLGRLGRAGELAPGAL